MNVFMFINSLVYLKYLNRLVDINFVHYLSLHRGMSQLLGSPEAR